MFLPSQIAIAIVVVGIFSLFHSIIYFLAPTNCHVWPGDGWEEIYGLCPFEENGFQNMSVRSPNHKKKKKTHQQQETVNQTRMTYFLTRKLSYTHKKKLSHTPRH